MTCPACALRFPAKLLLVLSSTVLSLFPLADLPGQDPALPAAALVDGTPILVSELQQELQSITGKLTLTEKARNQVARDLLERLIQRRLVMAYLERRGQAASRADLLVAREKLTLRLDLEKKSLEQYLRERKLDEQQLEFQLSWQLSWPRFLNKYLTDDNLQRYFDLHREQFDGTERRVAHILLKATGEQEIEQLRARQVSLRQQIIKGELTFAEAAREHSQSPTARQGGGYWLDQLERANDEGLHGYRFCYGSWQGKPAGPEPVWHPPGPVPGNQEGDRKLAAGP